MEQHKDIGNVYDLAARRVEVAREDLVTAKANLQEEHYRAANNRAYYSIYHAITAVFALENKAYKRHKDAIANFNKEYIKTEVFSQELGRRIGKAEAVRHNSDYDEFYLVTKEESIQQVQTAELLLEEIEKYLDTKKTGGLRS